MATSSGTQIDLWNETGAEVTGAALRKRFPEITAVPHVVQVVLTGPAGLAYLAWQIRKTTDKMLIVRCLASAVASIFQDKRNLTGSPTTPVDLTGIDPTGKEDQDTVETNLSGAEEVTYGELLELAAADPDEVAFYFGMLFLAAVKKVTPANRTAFNELRQETVKRALTVDPVVFVPDSEYLEDRILNKVYAACTVHMSIRANLFAETAKMMGKLTLGSQTTFAMFFMLLADSGLGSLRIIRDGVRKYPWIRTDFPELAPELRAATEAQRHVKTAPMEFRAFVKAVYGASYVPVSQAEIRNLLGVSKYCLQHSAAHYGRFGGGDITPAQQIYVDNKLGAIVTPQSSGAEGEE